VRSGLVLKKDASQLRLVIPYSCIGQVSIGHDLSLMPSV
jgi:hypothetical protein